MDSGESLEVKSKYWRQSSGSVSKDLGRDTDSRPEPDKAHPAINNGVLASRVTGRSRRLRGKLYSLID
ncbi:hypothetical protein RRG08_049431 [Elysia crispata]|uniref:Uncharacterized protein n=1 Tax=Elysia crispata TaxID=231223 RepID=A0AAE1DLR6_9GAST|nr:hypothetical protein RRG08_049431 [Elysia crispata]